MSAPPNPASASQRYACPRCGWFLLRTDAPSGRIDTNCRNRECRKQVSITLSPRGLRPAPHPP